MIGIFESESEVIQRLEVLRRQSRDTLRRIEHAPTQADRNALNRQLDENNKQSAYLQQLLRR